ncbi:MFS transporter [Streptosporangium longisporum]|uniref:Major facilitator superfamily (MFS) profile domain-containing protein n=1 Tax=Streptosporangium longisporum TaxID=46187 RepID=A0ABP6KXP1_9ACTN
MTPEVLRLPRFRLVYVGMAVSLLGDASLLLIPAILAKRLTGSDGAAGLTLFFFTLPLCLSPFFGYLIDRTDRRRLLVVTCLLSGVALLPLVAVTGPDTFWLVYPVSAAMGCSYAVIFAALGGLLKTMLPERLLGQANGALHTTRQGLRLVGPLLGVAIHAAFGIGALVLFDVVTFLVAAAVFAALPVTAAARPAAGGAHGGARGGVRGGARGGVRGGVRGRAPGGVPGRGPGTGPVARARPVREEFWAGARHLSADPPLRRAAGASCLMFTLAGATESLIFAVIEHGLGRSPEFTALTSVAMGLGAIAGGLRGPALMARRGELFVIGAGIVLYGVAILSWVVPAETVVLAAMAVAGAGLTMEGVARATLVQRRSPGHLVGRVSTAFESLAGVTQLFSLLAGAALVSVVDYRALLVLVGLTVCCAGGHALRGRARSVTG